MTSKPRPEHGKRPHDIEKRRCPSVRPSAGQHRKTSLNIETAVRPPRKLPFKVLDVMKPFFDVRPSVRPSVRRPKASI